MAAAARRIQQAEAEAALADRKVWNFDAAPVTDPVQELAMLAGRIRDAVETMSARAEVTVDCVCCGIGEPDATTSAALRALVKESRQILTDMARLGIEDRRVKVEERKIEIAVSAIRAALFAVMPTITEEQEILARDTVIRVVQQLEAAPSALS